MGGKVAMHFAAQWEDMLEKMVIVDMGIKRYPFHHGHILEGIHAVKLPEITARRQAEDQMKPHIDSVGVRQFLLKNLYWKEKGKLAWRMNVEVLEREMDDILSEAPEMEVVKPTLFIRGELSDYIKDSDIGDIEHMFIDSEIITIKDAGHWVHAENPDAFINALLSFCLR